MASSQHSPVRGHSRRRCVRTPPPFATYSNSRRIRTGPSPCSLRVARKLKRHDRGRRWTGAPELFRRLHFGWNLVACRGLEPEAREIAFSGGGQEIERIHPARLGPRDDLLYQLPPETTAPPSLSHCRR